jgi:hypothetical protein
MFSALIVRSCLAVLVKPLLKLGECGKLVAPKFATVRSTFAETGAPVPNGAVGRYVIVF